jgi:hypothetical protein
VEEDKSAVVQQQWECWARGCGMFEKPAINRMGILHLITKCTTIAPRLLSDIAFYYCLNFSIVQIASSTDQDLCLKQEQSSF